MHWLAFKARTIRNPAPQFDRLPNSSRGGQLRRNRFGPFACFRRLNGLLESEASSSQSSSSCAWNLIIYSSKSPVVRQVGSRLGPSHRIHGGVWKCPRCWRVSPILGSPGPTWRVIIWPADCFSKKANPTHKSMAVSPNQGLKVDSKNRYQLERWTIENVILSMNYYALHSVHLRSFMLKTWSMPKLLGTSLGKFC